MTVIAGLVRGGIADRPDPGEWEAKANLIGDICSSIEWWLGDILNYAPTKDAENDWVFRHTATDIRRVGQAMEVAAAFAPARRRTDLPWSFHQAVLEMPEPMQDQVLEQAALEGCHKLQAIENTVTAWRREQKKTQ